MSEDVDLTWIMASGKSVSDRRASLGFPPGTGLGRDGAGAVARSPNSGGGNWVVGLLLTLFSIGWEIAKFLLPIVLNLLIEALKLIGRSVARILTRH